MAQRVCNLIGNNAGAVAAPGRGVAKSFERNAKGPRRGSAFDLTEREAARRDDGVGKNGVVDPKHARALSMDVVEQAEGWIAPPQMRPCGVLQPLLDLAGLVCGRASSSSATAPATCGDDIEVPLCFQHRLVRAAMSIESLPPGAPMSGLKLRSGGRP